MVKEVKKEAGVREPRKERKEKELVKGEHQAVEQKKTKERRVLRKIEDFNKFTRLRAVKEARRRKDLTEKITIEPTLIAQAVKCLQRFSADQKANSKILLEDEDEFLYVEVTLSKLPAEYSIRPYQIKLPVPIYGEKYFSKHCIVVKDPATEYKEKIQDLNIPTIGKVLAYTKLVREYNTFEEKRKLAKEYDLFFCDYRIYDLLRKPIGKFFYDRKKIPFPIDCETNPSYSKTESYEEYLNSLNEFTYFIQSNGPNYAMKVGRVTMDAKDLAKNIQSATLALVAHLLESGKLEWDHVRRISLKTAGSPSLPVYSHLNDREKNLLAEAIQEAQE